MIDELPKKVEMLQDMLIAHATGGQDRRCPVPAAPKVDFLQFLCIGPRATYPAYLPKPRRILALHQT